MKYGPFTLAAIFATVLLLGGCMLPRAALDDAKQASSLMQQMQAQIDTMNKNESLASQRRLDELKALQTAIAQTQADYDSQTELSDAAGMTTHARLAALVQELAASQVQRHTQLTSRLATMDTTRAQILGNVPSTRTTVSKATADLAPLTKQRTIFVQAQFIDGYYKSVRTEIAKASAAAAAAASQAAANSATK